MPSGKTFSKLTAHVINYYLLSQYDTFAYKAKPFPPLPVIIYIQLSLRNMTDINFITNISNKIHPSSLDIHTTKARDRERIPQKLHYKQYNNIPFH